MSALSSPTTAVVALALLAATATAHAQSLSQGAANDDAWFGHDKLLHFEATSSLAVLGYAITSFATDDRAVRAGVGGAVALGAGIGKEIWDARGHGDASLRDLSWDAIGAATGVAVALAVDLLVARLRGRSAPASGGSPGGGEAAHALRCARQPPALTVGTLLNLRI